MHAMFLEHPWKEVIGKQAEIISQWVKNETIHKNLVRMYQAEKEIEIKVYSFRLQVLNKWRL